MPERLRLTSLEASVTLLNELFANTYGGHYSPEIAKALHPNNWRAWYKPEANPLRPEDFLADIQRSHLIDSVNRVIDRLPGLSIHSERLRKAVRLRLGIEDGTLHTFPEIAETINVVPERARQIEARALRLLRHPSRSRLLRDFLP